MDVEYIKGKLTDKQQMNSRTELLNKLGEIKEKLNLRSRSPISFAKIIEELIYAIYISNLPFVLPCEHDNITENENIRNAMCMGPLAYYLLKKKIISSEQF